MVQDDGIAMTDAMSTKQNGIEENDEGVIFDLNTSKKLISPFYILLSFLSFVSHTLD